jgi:hypothetical protein
VTEKSVELASVGTEAGEIPVLISYRIIELFSAGLYSSPHKAVEELVTNSYDASASHTNVIVPMDPASPGAVICVVDNGEGMDEAGFEQLWKIAQSNRRDPKFPPSERLPIGKFGIGKLATYALGRRLTHISKRDSKYLSVTMNFAEIEPDEAPNQRELHLSLRLLTEGEARSAVQGLIAGDGAGYEAISLFGDGAEESWTVGVVGDLTSLAKQIKMGRLKWILSTALPMSPAFRLYLNGEEVESAKEETQPLKEWVIGVDDKVAESQELEIIPPESGGPAVNMPGIGPVQGRAKLYRNLLTEGKATEVGRSHGFFVMVRGRLVNMDDPLFGLPALSHGPFARFWMRVDADGLDEQLRSTREAVLESEGVHFLQRYLTAKFNEARTYYDNWLEELEQKEDLAVRLAGAPTGLLSGPMIRTVDAVLRGVFGSLALTNIPAGLNEEQARELINDLHEEAKSESGIIREVKLADLGIDGRLATFSVGERAVLVNSRHPFYLNHAEFYKRTEPFELLAVAEVFSEAYLLDEGVDQDTVRMFMRRRDRFLRELVYTRELSAPMVAQLLHDAVADPTGLERAIGLAFRSLGFEVTPLGGKGKPDALASARLGIREELGEEPADYLVTLDAKSTQGARVKAKDVGASAIARHRNDYGAKFAMVVAVDFEGGNDPSSAVCKEARAHKITLVRAEYLARLVAAAATRRLGFTRFREWLSTCNLPDESKNWVDSVMADQPVSSPLKPILDAAWELAEKLQDPVKVAAIQARLADHINLKQHEIADWLSMIRRLVPELVGLDNDTVTLELPPDKIIEIARLEINKLPDGFRQPAVFQSSE